MNPSVVKNILSLRYLPTKKTIIPKLSWKDFVEKNTHKSTTVIEKSIREAIRNEIEYSKKRICVALSGGIDSTLILAIIRDVFPDITINAISIKFAESFDESEKAAKIARKFDANHHVLHIENYLQELPKAISIVKLPFWDLHWYYVVKKAKSLSNILLSGDGADELFGGYTFRYEKFLSLITSNSSALEKVKAYLQCHERDWVPDQGKLFGRKTKFSWNQIYKMLECYFDNPLSPLAQVFLADFNGKLLFNWLPLNSKFHKYFDVKPVLPILSRDLISYATHIPYHLKYNNRKKIGKILLRKILKKYVPDSLISGKKQGFSVDTLNLWKSYGRELCYYYLSDGRIVKEGWINKDWVRSHISKIETNIDVRYVNKLLGLLAFEIWFRLFITREMKSSMKLL